MAPKKKKGKARMSALLTRVALQPEFGPRCWATRLSGEVEEFVVELERQIAAGDFVNTNAVRRILEEEFDLPLNDATVRKHLRGNCKCKYRRR